MKNIYLCIVAIILTACSSPIKNTLKLSKDNFIGKWPFSVNEIEVFCDGYHEIYCLTSNGKTYALNGTAKSMSRNNASISKIEEIWLDDPDYKGLKIPYTDFITEGLKICENK